MKLEGIWWSEEKLFKELPCSSFSSQTPVICIAGRTAFFVICFNGLFIDTRWTGNAIVVPTDNSPKLSPNA